MFASVNSVNYFVLYRSPIIGLFFILESLFVFPCQWNYRPDHCIYGSNCREAEEEGVFILHGNRGVYHDDKQPAFRAMYEALRNVRFALLKLSLKFTVL